MSENTLYESKKKEIKDRVYETLGVTEEEFSPWDTSEYPVDQSVQERFYSLIRGSAKVRIFGDYDCDGICASYIMSRLVKDLTGLEAEVFIPDRNDGYGLREDVVSGIKKEDASLLLAKEKVTVITVDNGIAAADIVDGLKTVGYTVCITDHHELGEKRLPTADIVIDPKVKEQDPFSYDGYCGAGVAYKLGETVFSEEEKKDLGTIAAIATVADCMPFTGENHKLIREALQRMRTGEIPKAICLLGEEKGFSFPDITVKDIGFTFGPILNAPGRMTGKAKSAYAFLCHPTKRRAEKLIEINEKRKQVISEMRQDISSSIDASCRNEKYLIPQIVYYPDATPGLVGLIAGQLAERYKVPVTVLTDKGKTLRGSARSIEGFDLLSFFIDLHKEHPEWFVEYGGHKEACGVTFKKEYQDDILSYKRKYPVDFLSLPIEKAPVRIDAKTIPDVYDVLSEFEPLPIDFKLSFISYLHTYFDHPLKMGDNLIFKGNGYKVICPKASEIVPENEKKLDIIGHMELDSFWAGYTAPALRADKVMPYGTYRERSPVKETVSEKTDSMEEETAVFKAPLEETGEIDYSE